MVNDKKLLKGLEKTLLVLAVGAGISFLGAATFDALGKKDCAIKPLYCSLGCAGAGLAALGIYNKIRGEIINRENLYN